MQTFFNFACFQMPKLWNYYEHFNQRTHLISYKCKNKKEI